MRGEEMHLLTRVKALRPPAGEALCTPDLTEMQDMLAYGSFKGSTFVSVNYVRLAVLSQ